MATYLFLHGLGQGADSWDKTISHFSQREHAVCPVLWDFFEDETFIYDNLYRHFAQYCDKQEGDLHLCGLSLGAVLSLHYTIDHPAKIVSLVLIAPQYKMPRRLLQFQNILLRCMPKQVFSAAGINKQNFIRLSRSMIHLDFSDRLEQITCPTLVLCGEKDAINQSAAKQLAGYLPNGEFHFVPDAKHEVNMDAPEKLARQLNQFYEVQCS